MNTPEHNQPAGPDAGEDRGTASVVRTLRFLFAALRVLIVVVIVLAFFQGVFVVREQEQAMLFRFGRLVSKDGREILESGRLYWAWPYPVDEVRKIPAERAVTLESDHFWPFQSAKDLTAEEPPPGDEGAGLSPGRDGYLLTGDANIVHMTATVTYRIADARKYYLNFYSGEEDDGTGAGRGNIAAQQIILNCLENAILKETAGWSVDEIIKRSRAATGQAGSTANNGGRQNFLNNAVQARMETEVHELGLGVRIDKVTLTNVRPPLATARAFQRVNDSIQQSDTMLKDAQAFRDRVVNEAQSRKAEILAEARNYRQEVESTVRADLDYFLKVLDEYEDNPETMLVSLYTDTIRDVLKRVKERYIIHAREDGRQEVRLLLGREPERLRDNELQSEQP